MKFAKIHKLIDKNPMAIVGTIKTEETDNFPLSLGEIKIFVETVPAYYKSLFMFLFFTGVRFGEAAALKWKRVDFKNGKVHIRKTLVRGEYKDPTTKSSIRHIKLHPVAIEALRLQKKHSFGKRSCKDTRSSYITNSIDSNERIGFVQSQVGHTNTKIIIEHYYRHIPAPDDGKELEKPFVDTIEVGNLTQEVTE